MKRVLLFILLTSVAASAQVVLQRYDNFAATTTSASGIGNLTQVIPNATITVFNYPGVGTSCAGGGCVAATTYTSRTGGTACGGGLPLTRPTANTCLATADSQGNFGFWANAGGYQYCIAATNITTQCTNIVLGTGGNSAQVAFVDSVNTQAWAGSDFGAWMNSACTALNAGGKIIVDGGSRNFTTPIVCTPTVNPITIECPSEENSVWNYTPTTGIAVTFSGSNGGNGGAGIRNCTIKGAGSGNATVGLHLGTNALGIAGGYFPAMTIRGFGTGLEFNATGGTAFLNSFISAKIQNNGTGVKLSGEDNQFFGGLIGNNATGVTDPVAGEASFHGVGFDDNTTNAFNLTTSSTAVYCLGCRFENAALGTDQYIAISAGVFSYHGGQMVDDITTSTTTGFIQQSGGSFIDFGTTLKSGGRTVTQFDNISGTSVAVLHPWIQNVAQFPSLFTSSYTGAGVEASSLVGLNQNVAGITYKASQPGVTLDDSVDSGGAWLIKAIASNPGNGCSGVAGLDILQSGGQRLNLCTGGISIFGSTSGSSGLNAQATGGVINTLPSTAGTLTVTIGNGSVTTAGTAINTLTCQAQTGITVTGAATTDNVVANIGAALPATWQTGIVLSAHVTATNTVTVYLCNPTATASITPAATQVNVRVTR